MALQSAKNVRVAFKEETTYYELAGPTDAEFMRFTPSAGLQQTSADIRSNEQRADGLTTLGRSGSQQVSGTYSGEISIRSHDTLYQAAMRSTWQPALTLTEATVGGPTSFTTTTDAIVGAGGSWLTAGIRRGDVIRITGSPSAANNNRNLRVRAVTATHITVIETLVANASAATSFTVERGKKLVNGPTPVKRSFGVEQENVDINGTQYFGGCKWTGFKINGTPDGMAAVEFTILGAGLRTFEGSDSPYFQNPTVYNSVPLVFADARLAIAGEDVINVTQFELTYAINAATEPVVGTRISPDVFDNDASLEGSFSRIRADFLNVAAFVDETVFPIHVLLTEPVPEPKPYIAFYVPVAKYTDASAPLGGDGAMKEALPFTCGPETAGPDRDATLLSICTSAAA